MAVLLDRNLLKKRRNVLKMAILTKKSKIFIKAKLTASKSCLLRLVYILICCILRDAILLSLDLLKFQSLEFQIFYHFWLVLWYQSRFHAIYPSTIFCCTVPSKITQWYVIYSVKIFVHLAQRKCFASGKKDFVLGHKGHTVFNDFDLLIMFNFVTLYLNRFLYDAKSIATLQIHISDLQTWSNDYIRLLNI